MTYPRYSNGHVDDGHEVNVRRDGAAKRCSNCGALGYRETVSKEWCPSCGMSCDYWGRGANDVMQAHLDREAARQRREEEEERQREYEEWQDQRRGWG